MRDAGSVANLIQLAADIYKGTRAKFASIVGGIMSWFIDFITNMPDWLEVALVGVVLFVAFTKYEHWSKGREPKKQKDESGRQLSGITAERNKNKEEAQQEEADLKELDAKLKLAMNRVTVVEGQRDEYKGSVEDKEKKLSDCLGRNEALWKKYGKAVLWTQGRNWKSKDLSVAVQHVRLDDAELAKQIRGLLAIHLQDDSYSNENHTVEHILLPFENPSFTRVVLFSDSEVGIEVQDTFNRYQLINEKMSHLEKGFAGGEVPEVNIAIVVFPPDSSEDLTTAAG